MKVHTFSGHLFLLVALFADSAVQMGDAAEKNPADELPSYIRQVTWFGERADFSHDGKRIMFLSKTFGDAMELDLERGIIRNLTAHYSHHGYTRALYLSNGDILLSGPTEFDPTQSRRARAQCYLSVLDKQLGRPPTALGVKCFEGPAVSRSRMHIAWAITNEQSPDSLPAGASEIHVADIVNENSTPRLAEEEVAIKSSDLPFECVLETQNFVPRQEQFLTASAYGYQGTEVIVINLQTGAVQNLSAAPDQYDEPEGIFPDGTSTLVECDKQNHLGPSHVDLWRLSLDGGSYTQRLTRFSDYPGYKASNPVVSDDGQHVAFQLAKSGDDAGVGHGLFLLDLQQMHGIP